MKLLLSHLLGKNPWVGSSCDLLGPIFRGLCSENKNIILLKSSSSDVYTNLALEDCIYRTRQDTDQEQVLLWRNDPAVVIGRHQNPWTEANIPFLRDNKIKIARRNSGGGTVYHDQGNLNITFFTSKSRYNRKRNLSILCKAINTLGIDSSINERDDIIVDGAKKVSGTAAKLARNSAYHHCTLLVNVNTEELRQALNNPASKIIYSNATKSIRSPVENLITLLPCRQLEDDPVERLEAAIAQQLGMDPSQIVTVHPTEASYPGLEATRTELASWDWIFGKSPKFSVEWSTDWSSLQTSIVFKVTAGRIEDVVFHPDDTSCTDHPCSLAIIKSILEGHAYTKDLQKIVSDDSQQLHSLSNTHTHFIQSVVAGITSNIV